MIHRANRSDMYDTPFLDGIQAYVNGKFAPFHTPGHKQGRGALEMLRMLIGKEALAADVCDVLVSPCHQDSWDEVRKASEYLAAACFGADFTRYCVNGTTGAIHAAFLALCAPGDKVIVPRYSHMSVFEGLILTRATPHYIQATFDRDMSLPLPPTVAELAAAMTSPDVKGVVLTHPNYFGMTGDIDALVDVAHARSAWVLVDEAHGPHLRFHPTLPKDALAAGADVVVHSTHKSLGALTQASMLHAKRGRVAIDRLAWACSLLESTSPSPLLLASLDAVQGQMRARGRDLIDRTISLAYDLRDRINRIPGLQCYDPTRTVGVSAFDPTKVTIDVRGLGLTGGEVFQSLRRDYGCTLELATPDAVLALLSVGDEEEHIDRLVAALGKLARRRLGSSPAHEESVWPGWGRYWPDIPPCGMSPGDAMHSPGELVALQDAIGKVVLEFIAPYPPGIPLLVPGEVMTKACHDFIVRARGVGWPIKGLCDPDAGRIRVAV